MDRSQRIKVLNRDDCAVIYSIPEMNGLRRVFQPGETKQITYEELEKLSYIPGGRPLLEGSLLIQDSEEAISLLIGHVEPEYKYSKSDVLNLLKNGSLNELLDCLDFAPSGVKELIKDLAVELPLNDVAKRDAILEKLGFDVTKALEIQKMINDSDEKPEVAKRRVAKGSEEKEAVPSRRVKI